MFATHSPGIDGTSRAYSSRLRRGERLHGSERDRTALVLEREGVVAGELRRLVDREVQVDVLGSRRGGRFEQAQRFVDSAGGGERAAACGGVGERDHVTNGRQPAATIYKGTPGGYYWRRTSRPRVAFNGAG